MKNIPNKIIPGVGLGELKFGISRKQTKQILGEPDKIHKYSYTDSDENLSESWHYKNFGFLLGFDQEENWRLTVITVETENYKIHHNIFLGQEKNKISAELKQLNINDITQQDMATIENPTHELVSSDTLGINFWFDNNKLTEMQIGIVFIDDETIKWPE